MARNTQRNHMMFNHVEIITALGLIWRSIVDIENKSVSTSTVLMCVYIVIFYMLLTICKHVLLISYQYFNQLTNFVFCSVFMTVPMSTRLSSDCPVLTVSCCPISTVALPTLVVPIWALSVLCSLAKWTYIEVDQ